MPDLSTAIQCRRPLVVGAVGDRKILKSAIARSECDLVELRLDAIGWGPEVVAFAEKNKAALPILITARHPDEGGMGPLSSGQRAAALATLLPHAAMLDLELRSLCALAPTWEAARAQGLLRIASWHNFEACPGIEELLEMIRAMHERGADVAKVAFRIVEPGDLHTLMGVLRLDPPLPLAVMGMGPLAPASRLLAAQLGSVLNYGYLGAEATAPGQWPARLLKEAIAHSAAEGSASQA
jgi:3-dehydroquinate dehydratase-1